MCYMFYFCLTQIHPVDLSAVSDIRARHPEECHGLLASSAIINFGLLNRHLNKPVTVTVPVPPNPQKRTRPATAAVDRALPTQDRAEDSVPKPRPASAILGLVKKDGALKSLMCVPLLVARCTRCCRICSVPFLLSLVTRSTARRLPPSTAAAGGRRGVAESVRHHSATG